MILTTNELDCIDTFLGEQGECISSIQRAVHLDNECGGTYPFIEYFNLDGTGSYTLGESLYESILLRYWRKFDYLMGEYKCYINHGYYDYLYNHDDEFRGELQIHLDSLTEEQAIEISDVPYAMYFISKFNLDLKI